MNFKENTSPDKGGLVYPGKDLSASPWGLYDAWGKPFRVVLRAPGENRLTFLHAGKTVTLDTAGAVVSNGQDGKEGGGDDVQTW